MLGPGALLSRYQIVRPLGRGGMGMVFEALHLDLDKKVAIKTLHPEVASLPKVRARFVQEGRAAARISHPNVVDIFDVGEHDGIVFLVMEILHGEDLKAYLAARDPLTTAEMADLMLPVLAATAAAHENGIIHRDLKPANIFLTRGHQGHVVPKVLDFGISKIVQDQAPDLTDTGSLLGTPFYMSPEQAKGKKLAASSDQYSLGVILYECLTKKRAFDNGSTYEVLHAIVRGEFAQPRSLNPAIEPDVEQIVLRAMATKPEDRFASVAELGGALLPYASERVGVLWEKAFTGPVPVIPSPIRDPARVSGQVASFQTIGTSNTLNLKGRRTRMFVFGALLCLTVASVSAGVAGVMVGDRRSHDAPPAPQGAPLPPIMIPATATPEAPAVIIAPPPPPPVEAQPAELEVEPEPEEHPARERSAPLKADKRKLKKKQQQHRKKAAPESKEESLEDEPDLPQTDNLNPWN